MKLGVLTLVSIVSISDIAPIKSNAMVQYGDFKIHCHRMMGKWFWRVKNSYEILEGSSQPLFETEIECVADARSWIERTYPYRLSESLKK